MSRRGKRAAHEALVARLKTINGAAGGYATNLEGRVFDVLLFPDESPDIRKPYMCVVLGEPDKDPINHRTATERDDLYDLYFWAPEESSDATQSTALGAGEDWEDDVLMCLRQDWTLGGVCHDCNQGAASHDAGLIPGDEHPMSTIPVRVKQYLDATNLPV